MLPPSGKCLPFSSGSRGSAKLEICPQEPFWRLLPCPIHSKLLMLRAFVSGHWRARIAVGKGRSEDTGLLPSGRTRVPRSVVSSCPWIWSGQEPRVVESRGLRHPDFSWPPAAACLSVSKKSTPASTSCLSVSYSLEVFHGDPLNVRLGHHSPQNPTVAPLH